ncbi:MAG: hydratase [Hyphomicrobium sp.]
MPIPRRIRGTVRVIPAAQVPEPFAIDHAGDHFWQPIAPLARVEVAMQQPSLTWSGSGYFDHNRGAAPLEGAFRRWDWSRTVGGPATSVYYDVTPRSGADRSLAVSIEGSGRVSRLEPPPRTTLAKTLWQIARGTRCDLGRIATVVETLEDTPFYARSVVDAEHFGQPTRSMHESLDLDRFASPIVQAMLPFRMPRRAR